VLAELYPLPIMFAKGDWRALIIGNYKLMWNSRGRHKLLDLSAPAGEDDDRAHFEVARTEALLARLDVLTRSLPVPTGGARDAAVELDEATRRALQGLGYLEPAAGEPAAGEPAAGELQAGESGADGPEDDGEQVPTSR
jgi:hypothetical protein